MSPKGENKYPAKILPGAARRRVPGLLIRKCAGITNNSVPRGAKVIAIDVIGKTHSLSVCI